MVQYRVLLVGDFDESVERLFRENEIEVCKLPKGSSAEQIYNAIAYGDTYCHGVLVGPDTQINDSDIFGIQLLKVIGFSEGGGKDFNLSMAVTRGIPALFPRAANSEDPTLGVVQRMCDFLHKGVLSKEDHEAFEEAQRALTPRGRPLGGLRHYIAVERLRN